MRILPLVAILCTSLGAQDLGVGVHLGLALSESQRFGTVGISSSWAWQPRFSARIRADHSIHAIGDSRNQKNGSYDSQGFDIIWHKNGVNKNGLIMGIGYSGYQVKWDELTYYTQSAWRPKSEHSSGPHFLAGAYIGPHFHFEGHVNLSIAGDTGMINLLGSIGWTF